MTSYQAFSQKHYYIAFMQKEKIRILSVPFSYQGLRLDQAVGRLFPDISRSQAQRLIEADAVLMNGELPKKRSLVREGDTIQLVMPEEIPSSLIPQEISFHVLYEDEALFVINKPAGMVVHPACGHWEGTFAHGFLAHCRGIEGLDPIRPGIVHRLDKETSGVLIGAKTEEAVRILSHQFHERLVQKWYEALLVGEMKREMTIDRPIGRDPQRRKQMACLDTGRASLSHFIPLICARGLTHARISIQTGRTHQIRVHAASCGYPVLGDSVYGRKEVNNAWCAKRQMLHCSEMIIFHPMTQREMRFHAPLPLDMNHLLEQIGKV